MNRPVRSPLARRAHPLAPAVSLPCFPCIVVPARPSSVRAAISAARVVSYDMGYAR